MTAIQRESWGGGALVEFNSCYGYPEQPSKSRPQPQGEQAGKGPGGAALAQQRELPPGAAASAPAPSSASPRLRFQALGRPAGQGQEGKERGQGGHLGQPPGRRCCQSWWGGALPPPPCNGSFAAWQPGLECTHKQLSVRRQNNLEVIRLHS